MDIEKVIEINAFPAKEGPELKKKVIELFADVLSQREATGSTFNLDALDRFIFTLNYRQELRTLAKELVPGIWVGFSGEEEDQALANTIVMSGKDGFYHVMLFNIAPLFETIHQHAVLQRLMAIPEVRGSVMQSASAEVKELIAMDIGPSVEHAKYILAHEMGRVHGCNRFLRGKQPGQVDSAMEGILRPMAAACWGEYLAAREAAFAVTPYVGDVYLSGFSNALDTLSEDRREKINRDDLNGYVSDCIAAILKFSCCILGWIDGEGEVRPADVPEKADAVVNGSSFEDVFVALKEELGRLNPLFPDGWGDASVYTGLEKVVHLCFEKAGVELAENG